MLISMLQISIISLFLFLAIIDASADSACMSKIQEVIRNQNEEELACATGGCFLYSQATFYHLSKSGIENLRRINAFGIITLSGALYPSSHAFVVKTIGATQIIIDSTYLQFFKNGQSLGLPKVFIGTKKELTDVFKKFRAHIADIPRTIDGNKIDPVEFVEKVWPLEKPSHFKQYDVQSNSRT